jgi:hypothetical protein
MMHQCDIPQKVALLTPLVPAAHCMRRVEVASFQPPELSTTRYRGHWRMLVTDVRVHASVCAQTSTSAISVRVLASRSLV